MLFNYFEQLYFHHKLDEIDWQALDKVRNNEEMNMFLESMEEHFAQVRNEGKREGILEGILEGKREGVLEGKIETAKAMLKEGLPTEFIAKMTNLSVSEIEQLITH